MITDKDFSYAKPFSEGLAAVSGVDNKVGFIDQRGYFVIEPNFQNAFPFSEGLAVVYVMGKSGFVDRTGNFAFPQLFDAAMPYDRGQAWVYTDGFWHLINHAGVAVSDTIQGSPPETTSEGFTAFNILADQWGYWDQHLNIAIPPTFENAEPFSEGLAAVKHNGKYGFIDKLGDFQVPPVFDSVREGFHDGLATVAIDSSRYAVIDTHGNILQEPTCDHTR